MIAAIAPQRGSPTRPATSVIGVNNKARPARKYGVSISSNCQTHLTYKRIAKGVAEEARLIQEAYDFTRAENI
jgi:hypothetical protein